MSSFADAWSSIEEALAGTTRQDLVSDLAKAATLGQALGRLRQQMRGHAIKVGSRRFDFAPAVAHHDARTRADGFHALHDWDGKASHFNPEIIPVDVLDFLVSQRRSEPPNPTAIAILLDYYFVYLLGLLSLRVWDEGDPSENLATLTRLLQILQDSGGSGQQFAADAETLMLIVTSHYEPDDAAYDRLLEKTRALDAAHQLAVALVHAQSMGCHLRYGFEATYGQNMTDMRNDNTVDYRWLCFALATVMREYGRMHEEHVRGVAREFVVEALVSGLSADTRAFVRERPASLKEVEADRTELGDLFATHKTDLLAEIESHRPSEQAYSPISFFYNFAQNVPKGAVVDALLWGEAWTISLNDLWTAIPRGEPRAQAKTRLATTLTRYARASPDTVRGRPTPAIVYDPPTGRRVFGATRRMINE
jgi:hypothetical protein